MLQSFVRCLAVAGLILAQSFAAQPSPAATLATVNPHARNDPSRLWFTPECNAELHGKINSGDAEEMAVKLKAFMARIKTMAAGEPKQGQFLALCLNSRGGDLIEALKIRELLNGWMMVVPANAYCMSACAIIFMSAPPRENVFFYRASAPGRFLHRLGNLGFHAPALNFPASEVEALMPSNLTGEARSAAAANMAVRVQTAYNDALARMRAVGFPGDQGTERWDPLLGRSPGAAETQDQKNERYARLFTPNPRAGGRALPAELLFAFLTVPHDDALYVSRIEQAIRWGIEIFGIEASPVLTSGMLGMACINVAAARCLRSPNGLCYDQSRRGGGVDFVIARVLNNHRKSLEFGYNSLGGVLQTPASNISQLIRYQFRRTPFSYNFTETTRDDDTPKPQNVQAEVLEMLAGGTKPVCDVRAIWRDERLIDLTLEIVEGHPPEERALHLKPVQRGVGALLKEDESLHLKPWKMMPGFAKLKDLGGVEAWGRLSEGGNFFSKPPNW